VDFFYLDDEQKKYLEQFFTRYMEPYWAERERSAVPPAAALRQG